MGSFTPRSLAETQSAWTCGYLSAPTLQLAMTDPGAFRRAEEAIGGPRATPGTVAA